MAKARKSTMAAPQAEEIATSDEQGTTAQSEIARRAYEIYLARGATDGRDVEDWLQAESEVAGDELG